MSTASNAIKTGVFTLFVPAVVGVGVPQSMVAGEHTSVSVPTFVCVGGVILIGLGVIGYLWCATLFVLAQGTPAPISPTKIVVARGPYRINRNPVYSSVLAVVFGQALFYQRWSIAGYGALLAICFHLFVMLYEEPSLRVRFDGKYEEFCRRVPRWIPRMSAASRR